MNVVKQNRYYIDRWTIEFLALAVITMILAGIFYYIQFEMLSLRGLEGNLFRMMRMLIVYVLPSFLFAWRHKQSILDLGLCLPKNNALLSIFGGCFIYCLVGVIFIQNRIFYAGWAPMDLQVKILHLLMIGVMAAVTDYWTRGFILLSLEPRYGPIVAIIAQNAAWFILHIYEIILLSNYISYAFAIFITLFLGISGDLIALKTRSLYGLMLGHILLNLMVVIDASYGTLAFLRF
jgi:membrane protease YdiL (CAAX protease family)